MSMKGDLPGLSNFCPGTIGSCQYKTRRPVAGSAWSPAIGEDAGAVPAICIPSRIPYR